MKLVTFHDFCELMNEAKAIPETSEFYQEVQEILRKEVTNYNLNELQKILDSYKQKIK